VIVSEDRYRLITLDTASTDVQVTARIEQATAMVEDVLQRPLEAEERTEILPVTRWSRVYPKATPIASVTSPTGAEIEDSATLRSVTPDSQPWTDWDTYGLVYGQPKATVTYIGGWNARDSGSPASTLVPATVERAVAQLAHALVRQPDTVLVGATSVSLGDVSVTYGSARGEADVLVPGLVQSLRPYRRKPRT
jgi:hypothetical protein